MDNKKIASQLLLLAKEVLGMDFPTQDALDKYLKDHPDADRSNHKVVKTEKKKKKGPSESEKKVERIPVPKFDDLKSSAVSDADQKELVDVNYREAVKMLEKGESGKKRLTEILDGAKKRIDEIKTTLKQWEEMDTMPKDIVDRWEEELGKLPYQTRGVEKALKEFEKK